MPGSWAEIKAEFVQAIKLIILLKKNIPCETIMHSSVRNTLITYLNIFWNKTYNPLNKQKVELNNKRMRQNTEINW